MQVEAAAILPLCFPQAKDRIQYYQLDEVFIFPYDMGSKWKNFKQVFTWSGVPEGDGLEWPIREGCDQYSLTIEPLKQKADKRVRSVRYKVIEDYNGACCPLNRGVRTFFTLAPLCQQLPGLFSAGDHPGRIAGTGLGADWVPVADRLCGGLRRGRGDCRRHRRPVPQLFVLDFDEGISLEAIELRAEEYHLEIAFKYFTFSSTEENPKFRIVFLSDVPVHVIEC